MCTSRSVAGRLRADGVHDVLSVRPALHQARRDEGRRAHRRPVPRHPHVPGQPRRASAASRDRRPTRQLREQFLGRHRPARGERGRVHRRALRVVRRARTNLRSSLDEAVRIVDREHGRLVEVQEVGDLVEHAPPGARRRQPPLRQASAGRRHGRARPVRRRGRPPPAPAGAGTRPCGTARSDRSILDAGLASTRIQNWDECPTSTAVRTVPTPTGGPSELPMASVAAPFDPHPPPVG